MPYRKLPNTDESRIRALRTALEKSRTDKEPGEIISEKTLKDAENFYPVFEGLQQDYLQSLENQKVTSKKYYAQMATAKLYISHFIQVLNFCIIRKEIKKEAKKLYGLEPDNFNVPDLSTEASIIKWGESIINGERDRISSGGTPIYNPAIAKVSVHYDLFKDTCISQKVYQKNTNRFLEQITSMRDDADKIILDIWNQVEDHFKKYPEEQKHEFCQEYGIRYYLRKNEMDEKE